MRSEGSSTSHTVFLPAPRRDASAAALLLALRHRRALITVANLTIVVMAYVLAFQLRFDFRVPERHYAMALQAGMVLLICKMVAFWWSGLFNGWWRHASIRDLIDVVRGNLIGSTLFVGTVVLAHGMHGFPRSILIIDLLLCTTLMAGARLAARLSGEVARDHGARRIDKLVLIVGTGHAAMRLAEEIEGRPRLRSAVVGFVDTDPHKRGLRMCGLPVLGTPAELPLLVKRHDVGEVLVALPDTTSAVRRAIVQQCTDAGVRYRVLPTLAELVDGRVMFTQVREVRVEDLLAREPVQLDLRKVRTLIGNSTVLVSGAVGSIGSELCRQVAQHNPRRVVLYDRHENGMFHLEAELRTRFPSIEFVPILGDVLLPDQLRDVFARERPNLVLHAAAFKHVPLAEQNVIEAVRNNVLGTFNIAKAALAHGTREFVLVSTDKAVSPTSVMGLTKRAAEIVIQGLSHGSCRFVAVRFGNVLGSSGSVVPLFRDQIARGGPITVTHQDVTRYFMTIPEASQLILQAASSSGRSSEIFILEMGDPVRITDLAEQMIRLSGLEPHEDIEIRYTGLRPGEKLAEELVGSEEEVQRTSHDRIRVLRPRSVPELEEWLTALATHVKHVDPGGALRLLQQVVPEYHPSADAAAWIAMEDQMPEREAQSAAS